jgi:hypothetical protein
MATYRYGDALRNRSINCSIVASIDGQTRRQAGTQSLRSAGSKRSTDSGVAGSAAKRRAVVILDITLFPRIEDRHFQKTEVMK